MAFGDRAGRSPHLLPADYWFRNDDYEELKLHSVVPDREVTAQNIAQLEQLRDEYGKDGRFAHENSTLFLRSCGSNVPFRSGPQHGGFASAADEARAVREAIALEERGAFNPDLKWTEHHYLVFSLAELRLAAAEILGDAVSPRSASATDGDSPDDLHSTKDGELLTTNRPIVFVVHGHDHTTRDKINAFLRKQKGLEIIVLDEEPDRGARSSRSSTATAEGPASPSSSPHPTTSDARARRTTHGPRPVLRTWRRHWCRERGRT